MFLITKNSTIKTTILSTISRRLSSVANQQEIDEKKAKEQKYQELEKLQYRPLYLDAQATTPMVEFIRLKNIYFYLFEYRIHVFLIKCYHI